MASYPGHPPYGTPNSPPVGADSLSTIPPAVASDFGPERPARAPSVPSAASPPHLAPASTAGAPSAAAAPAPSPAGAAAGAPAPRVRRRNRMITSCLECRRRKLKCDKAHPCANCTRAARDCVFLAPALDSASQLKLTEIKEKMGSLERVLEQDVARNGAWRAARRQQQQPPHPQPSFGGAGGGGPEDDGDFAPIPDDERELEPTPLAVSDAVYDDDADDDLMDLGVQMGKLRLTDRLGGFFRPKIADEITVSLTDARNDRRPQSEKSVSPEPPPPPTIPRPQNFMAPGPTYIPPTGNFFFASHGYGSSLIDYLPARSAADRLLQQYWHAVHPICRAVHRPSFQRRYEQFWAELDMGIEPIGSLQAVVFAAMFSAVVSMPDELIWKDFARLKKDLVHNFQQGTETALSSANVLRTTKVETIQAFVMYMLPLCRDQMSRAHSALVGTAIRLAECMGLHRDGTAYGLSAVETHVRRMLWYELCMLDIRTCEAQGPRPGIREGEFDTRFPLNVDDDALEREGAGAPPADRWTDMTLTLIRLECNEMMRTIWFDRPRLEKKQMSLTAVLGKIENFKRTLYARYTPMLDPTVPLHRVAQLLMNILSSRMQIMVLHRYHNSVSFRIPDRLRQIILTSGTDQLEDAIRLETQPALAAWSWFAGAVQQYQTAFLLLAEVFTYPMRREADRIWAVVDYVFETPRALSRDAKARLILTELRDRVGLYREVRKLRAPTTMMRRLGLQAPRAARDLPMPGAPAPGGPGPAGQGGAADDDAPIAGLQPPPPGPTHDRAGLGSVMVAGAAGATLAAAGPVPARQPALLFPSANGEIRGPSGEAGGGGGGGVDAMGFVPQGSGMPLGVAGEMAQGLPPPDDLMDDIDWNEWDKLFPPDINTGELNMPMTSVM